jgi:hypothetical protein
MLRGINICIWLGVFVFAAGAFCQNYVGIIVFPTPFGTIAKHTVPTSINEQGEIAGYYTEGAGDTPHGFVRAAEGGTITSFDVPGSFHGTFAFSINAAGAITGYFNTPPLPPLGIRPSGFVRNPEGNFTTFDPPGSISTMPQSINARGAITGYYNESNLLIHGFVRESNGTITSFDPPESISTMAVGINANGTITGYFQVANMRVHGFIRHPKGTIVRFDPPESTGTIVAGINNAGTITGYYTVASGRTFGFVRDTHGRFTSFDPGFSTFPTSINNDGAITGYTTEPPLGAAHGFVRAPGGAITSFDPPTLATGCFPVAGSSTDPTSINDNGVITGLLSCLNAVPSIIGFARYP